MACYRGYHRLSVAILVGLWTANGFLVAPGSRQNRRSSISSLKAPVASNELVQPNQLPDHKDNVHDIKRALLDLLPGMTGREEEFRQVERLVNLLEDKYLPVQTLGFLNLAMAGEWQLLFSTGIGIGGSGNHPARFRLRELFQRIETQNRAGTITNQALWDLAEDGDHVFDATGTFSAVCSYSITQGARMVVQLQDHILKPARGSKIPRDVPGLVGRLHRAMPKELFDPQDHAMDTTYLDADLRIVRMTGPRLEGVRDIFIRRGGLVIDPTNKE